MISQGRFLRSILDEVLRHRGQWVTAQQIANSVGCSRRTVINLLSRLPYLCGKPGVGYFIDPSIQITEKRVMAKSRKRTSAGLEEKEGNKREDKREERGEEERNSILIGFTISVNRDGKNQSVTLFLLPRHRPEELIGMIQRLREEFPISVILTGRVFRGHLGAIRFVLSRGADRGQTLFCCAVADFYDYYYRIRGEDFRIRHYPAWLLKMATMPIEFISLHQGFGDFFKCWVEDQKRLLSYLWRVHGSRWLSKALRALGEVLFAPADSPPTSYRGGIETCANSPP